MGTKHFFMICFMAGLVLLIFFPTGSLAQPPYYGKYRGTVIDINDPLGEGRIMAAVPAVFGVGISPWALPAFPFAGLNHGLILLPEVGDNVWIEFEGGNPNFPIWTGGWLSSGAVPVPNLETKRMLFTSKGHKILLDDASNRFELVHASGPEIIMTNQDIALKVGNTTLTIKTDGVFINNQPLKAVRLYLPLLTNE